MLSNQKSISQSEPRRKQIRLVYLQHKVGVGLEEKKRKKKKNLPEYVKVMSKGKKGMVGRVSVPVADIRTRFSDQVAKSKQFEQSRQNSNSALDDNICTFN